MPYHRFFMEKLAHSNFAAQMICQLCGASFLSKQLLAVNEIAFCCHGCEAVHTILTKKGEKGDLRSSTLFLQAVQANLIANDSLLVELESKQKNQKCETEREQRLVLEIGDMWCPSCAEVIRLVLLQAKGLLSCAVDYATDLATVTFDPLLIGQVEIEKAISALGYSVKLFNDPTSNKNSSVLWLRFIVAAFGAANVMMLAYPIYATYFDPEQQGVNYLLAVLSALLSLPVITWCCWPLYCRAINSSLVGIIRMEALVSMGVLSAAALSFFALFKGSSEIYFDSATVIVALVLLGRILEAKAKFSSKKTMELLTRLIPRRCLRIDEEGNSCEVLLKEVAIGEIIAVKAGEKVPLDGEIAGGEGNFDEALVTGEAIPCFKQKGEKAVAGSLLLNGYVTVRVEKTLDKSLLLTIIKAAESSLKQKAGYVRLVDSIVPWFVAALFFVALFSFALTGNPANALAVLMISCPCALGIAAPLAESKLLHLLAGRGVIVKNRGCLPLLGKSSNSVWVCDKTGTLTTGSFAIEEGLSTLNEEELSILKSMTASSWHPISRAIYSAIPKEAGSASLQRIEEKPGKGIKATNSTGEFWLGSAKFMEEANIALPATKAPESNSSVFFARDKELLTAISLKDEVRKEAIEFFGPLEAKRKILLSGDGRGATQAVALQCHFSEYFWGQLPADKFLFVNKLRQEEELVYMIGDGVNDAMALSAAHIGISMASATDISRNVSDIVLATDELSVLKLLQTQGAKTQKIIVQNIFWAFFYNVLGVPLAALGYLSPLFAAFAMTASSLIILLNTQRIGRGKE